MSWAVDHPPLYITPVTPEEIERGDGDEVCETIEALCSVTKDGFAAVSGDPLRLRDWQKELLRHLFARRADGRRRHRVALIGMPRKNGKALALDTPVLTAAGWSTMGALSVGDLVHSVDGSLTEIVAATDPMPDRPCYRLRFFDGSEIVADAEHEWVVWDQSAWKRVSRGNFIKGGDWKTVTTSRIAESYRIGNRASHQERRYAVRMDRILKRRTASLPVDPYILGAWLGDGSSASARLSVSALDLEALLVQITEAGYFARTEIVKGGNASVQVSTTPVKRGGPYKDSLQGRLRLLGLLNNKHVPEPYLLASEQQRLALLQGLMDTDGTATNPSATSGSPRVEFCNTNRQLADSVLFLARSLGWKATIKAGRARMNGVDCGPKYRVFWNAYSDQSPFRLARKTLRLAPPPESSTRSMTNKITDVQPVESVSVRCIQVAHPSGQFLVGYGLIPTHNSALGSGLALDGLLFDGKGSEVYSAAAEKEQARIVFGETKKMIASRDDLASHCNIMKDVIEVPATGSIYRCLSAEAYSKEGLNISRCIYDELHAQPNDDLWNVLTLGSAARLNPLTLAITTAGVMSDTTGRDSVCYRLFRYGVEIANERVEDPSFFMAWWGAPQGADHTDPDVWKAANPGFGDLIDPEDFAAAVKRTPENEYRSKRLNQWVAALEAWFPAGVFEAATDAAYEIKTGQEIVLACDASFDDDATVVACATVGTEPIHVDILGAWEKPEDDNEWRVPIGEVEDCIRAACKKYKVREVNFDPHRWARTMEALHDERLPIVEFPQAQPLDEPVLTPDGWRAIGDLAIGDSVMGADGCPVQVTGINDFADPRDVYAVHLTDGSSTRCTGDHLWRVFTPHQRNGIGKASTAGSLWTLDEIKDRGLRDKTGRLSQRFLPMPVPVSHETKSFLIDPYLLGLLLGDGSMTKSTPGLTSVDAEITDAASKLLPEGMQLLPSDKTGVQFSLKGQRNRNPITDELRRLGLHGGRAWEKFIPDEYLLGDADQRLALLQGLMDTDGSAAAGTGDASLHTTSVRLREGVKALAQSLGGTARASYRGKQGKMQRNAYWISIALPPGKCPFRLARKASLAKRQWQPSRAMAQIELWGRTKVRCITVDAPDGLYITNEYILTHNSNERMVPATARFYSGIAEGKIKHSGDMVLMRHVANAQTKITPRGPKVVKDQKSSPRKIDAAIASVMAVARAQELKPRKPRVLDLAAAIRNAEHPKTPATS